MTDVTKDRVEEIRSHLRATNYSELYDLNTVRDLLSAYDAKCDEIERLTKGELEAVGCVDREALGNVSTNPNIHTDLWNLMSKGDNDVLLCELAPAQAQINALKERIAELEQRNQYIETDESGVTARLREVSDELKIQDDANDILTRDNAALKSENEALREAATDYRRACLLVDESTDDDETFRLMKLSDYAGRKLDAALMPSGQLGRKEDE